MILFESDWGLYPHAIADTKTTNTSFIRQAQVYKKMGVRNHMFLLALLQPELQGVDPHDPNLTLDQKAMIAMEVQNNPWYYFREVVRLPAVAGTRPVRFIANRGNIAVYWSFFNNIDCANIQPRQTGKSASTDCLMDWVIYIGAKNTMVTMITKDDSLRKANVERLKSIRDLLPKYLVTITARDADNQNELTCKLHDNKYVTGVAQNSESAANNLGRGLTSPILHLDEGPFINFVGTSLPAALTAGNAARAEAEKFGRPYGNIFTTTAGKKDDRDGRFMYNLIHGGAEWSEHYYDAPDKKTLVDMLTKNMSGKKLLVNITMSHRQLGYTDEWLYKSMAENATDGDKADRDFLNIWTSGSQRSPLKTALLEKIFRSDQEPVYTTISQNGYLLRWYVPEWEVESGLAEGHYVWGLDTSDAVGRDTIALVLTDVRDLSVVAAGTFNETNLMNFAAFMVELLVKFLNTTLIIERKSSAPAIIDYMLLKLPAMGLDPFKRIFNKVVDKGREDEDAFNEIQRGFESRNNVFYDRRKAAFGFVTNAENRTVLYTTVLQNAAKNAGQLVRDRALSAEIRGLVEKNGRIDHDASGHDDHVIAWLLTHWLLTHGRNLAHYGIRSSEVMCDINGEGSQLTDSEVLERERQASYLTEIEELLDKLKESSDEMSIAKYEHRLRVLSLRIDGGSSETSSTLDALIVAATEERVKRRRLQAHQGRGGRALQMNSGSYHRYLS